MEKIINRQSILRATLWGVGIYAHILRKFYPNEVVMKVVGRDCGICKNPFAHGARTLHIWFERNNPDGKLSEETAYHKDQLGSIPDGDAFDFAELYYHQSGQELLNTLNREMNLHLDGAQQYENAPANQAQKGPEVSFFKGPIQNTTPFKSVTIRDIYNYIIGPEAKPQTDALRAKTDIKAAKLFKATRFDFVTFSAELEFRNKDSVIRESSLLCIDFDHVKDKEGLKKRLLNDSTFTTVLLFTSPSGDGLKWVIEADRGNHSHSELYKAVENYISKVYGVEADGKCKDIARACFLPHDPDAYINPQYL